MKSIIKQILQKTLGMRIYLYLFSNFIIYSLPFNKRENDFLHFAKMIKGDGLILDIGANIGIMTFHLAKLKPNSTIIAFEPIPMNIDTLTQVVKNKRLNNVKIFPFALGNEDSRGKMVVPEVEQVKMQGLSHVIHESITDFNEGKIFDTEIKKLDNLDIIKNSKDDIIAIKMDVENYEYFVLEGAIETIKRHKPIIYTELWENENRNNCLNLMQNLNYQPYIITNNQLEKFDSTIHKSQNFFFIPKK
jgi:FkbM family methyltransferase